MEPEKAFDENYEYNCPRFVDFSVPHVIDDNADEFFGKQSIHSHTLCTACTALN